MWALQMVIQFIPVSWVLRPLSWCPTQFSVGLQMPLDFFKSHEIMKCLTMCENFNFPTVAKNIYRNMTAINQPLTWRNRTVPTLLLLMVPYCYITPQLVLSKNMPHLSEAVLWVLMPIGWNTSYRSVQLCDSVVFFLITFLITIFMHFRL